MIPDPRPPRLGGHEGGADHLAELALDARGEAAAGARAHHVLPTAGHDRRRCISLGVNAGSWIDRSGGTTRRNHGFNDVPPKFWTVS